MYVWFLLDYISQAMLVVSQHMGIQGLVWEMDPCIEEALQMLVLIIVEAQVICFGFITSDYADNFDKRRSLTIYIFTKFGSSI